MTILEQVIISRLKSGLDRVCIDPWYHQIVKEHFYRCSEILYLGDINPTSWRAKQIRDIFLSDLKKLKLEELCSNYGYELWRGRKTIFAIKQKTLDLF